MTLIENSCRRHSQGSFFLRLILILLTPFALLAEEATAVKPFWIEPEPPQVVQSGAIFPYLWVLRDGSALLEVAKGKRTYRSPRGWEYSQQDPQFLVSRDGLKTWKPWREARRFAELPWFEGAVVELHDGALLMFEYVASKVSKGLYEGRMWRAAAGWRKLEGPFPFNVSVPNYEESGDSDQGKPFLGMPWHRSVIEMPDGSLLAAIYGRFDEDRTPSEYQPTMRRFRSFTVTSHDGGKTWAFLSTIASAPVEQEGFDEPVMVRLSQGEHKGRLICLMRTGRLNPLYQSESDDDGKSWTSAHSLHWTYSKFGHTRDIVGTDPDLIEMRDGTLVVSFGHKPDFEDDGNFVAFSVNQGQSWTQMTRLSMEPTCAYTSVSEITPGVLYVTYSAEWKRLPPRAVDANRAARYKILSRRITVHRQ